MHRGSGQGRRPTRGAQAGKTLVPLLSVLTALAMGVAAFAIVLQMQEREKRQARELELQRAMTENQTLTGKLQDLQQAKARVEDDLSHTRKELTQSQDDLAKTVQDKETLAKSVEDREKEIARLAKDLEQSQSDAKRITTQLSEIQSAHDLMKQQLADAEKAKGDLESKVMELSKRPTVELDKVLVTNEEEAPGGGMAVPVSTAATGSSLAEGQVVVVNREYDFIVMNLGKHHGLSVGQEFQVVRGGEILGKVKVEKIYDELSAAAILPDSKKENIREGDTVRAL